VKSADVVIVGGGVIGAAAAYHLQKAGVQVLLIEKRGIAAGASGASAGGVRQQNRHPAELPIAMRSVPLWETMAEELGYDVEYRQGGNLYLVEREEYLSELRAGVEEQRRAGLDVQMVQGEELRELVPLLAPSVLGAGYCPNDGYANPILTTQALALAAQKLGAHMQLGTAVTELLVHNNRIQGVTTTQTTVSCSAALVAAGAWSRDLLLRIGVEVPVKPYGLQMMCTEPVSPFLTPVIGCRGRNLSIKQMPQGQVVIGGGWSGTPDMARDRGWPQYTSIQGSAGDFTAIFPHLRRNLLVRVWVGLEAMCLDGLPVLGGVSGLDGLLIATGFSGHGFALAPYVGQLVTEMVTTGETSLSLDSLSLERFSSVDCTIVERFLRSPARGLEPA
jgi:sarcosine oxidase subunit beta